MYKFYENNLVSGFIKNLLSKTNIPIYDFVQDGDFLIEGCNYIYQGNVIKCTSTGILNGTYSNYYVSNLKSNVPDEVVVQDYIEYLQKYEKYYLLQIQDVTIEGTKLILNENFSKAQNIIVPSQIQKNNINSFSLSENKNIKKVFVQIGITSIVSAFYKCTSLEQVFLPNSVSGFMLKAFQECTNLTTVNIPFGLQSVLTTFDGCTSIESIILPDGITQIGANAFQNCENLTYIYIPKSVKRIFPTAFAGVPIVDEHGDPILNVAYGGDSDDLGTIDFGGGNPLSQAEFTFKTPICSLTTAGYTDYNIPTTNPPELPEPLVVDYNYDQIIPTPQENVYSYSYGWEGYLKELKTMETAEFEVISAYQLFQTKESGNVYNFISNTNYYDSETHRYLGDYLRAYKGTNDINLLPFYNCFSLQSTDNFWINEDVVEEVLTPTGNYVYLVPVKFDKKYTICVDNIKSMYVTPVLANSLGRIKSSVYTKKSYTEDDKEFIFIESAYLDEKIINIEKISNASFRNPILWEVSLKDYYLGNVEEYNTETMKEQVRNLYNQEDNLYLVIQVPQDTTSSIVVLEGDYLLNIKTSNNYVTSQDDSVSSYLCDFFGPLSLLQINTKGTILPFSDRLIEFLLLNVIDSNEEIGKNILRVQQYINYKTTKLTRGVWQNLLQAKLFENYMNFNRDPLYYKWDITGFVDKDVERQITRGKKV